MRIFEDLWRDLRQRKRKSLSGVSDIADLVICVCFRKKVILCFTSKIIMLR